MAESAATTIPASKEEEPKSASNNLHYIDLHLQYLQTQQQQEKSPFKEANSLLPSHNNPSERTKYIALMKQSSASTHHYSIPSKATFWNNNTLKLYQSKFYQDIPLSKPHFQATPTFSTYSNGKPFTPLPNAWTHSSNAELDRYKKYDFPTSLPLKQSSRGHTKGTKVFEQRSSLYSAPPPSTSKKATSYTKFKKGRPTSAYSQASSVTSKKSNVSDMGSIKNKKDPNDKTESIGYKRIVTSSEEQTISEICLLLSDEETPLQDVLFHLDHLAKVLHEDAELSMFFFDRGGVVILTSLLQRLTQNLDVSIRICRILRTICLDKRLVNETLASYGGVECLLNVIDMCNETIKKQASVLTRSHVLNSNVISKYGSGSNMATNLASTPTRLGGSLVNVSGASASPDTLENLHATSSHGSKIDFLPQSNPPISTERLEPSLPTPRRATNSSALDLSSDNRMGYDMAMAAFLLPYFDPLQLAKIDSGDKITRARMFRQVLNMLIKISHLVNIITAYSSHEETSLEDSLIEVLDKGGDILEASSIFYWQVDMITGDLILKDSFKLVKSAPLTKKESPKEELAQLEKADWRRPSSGSQSDGPSLSGGHAERSPLGKSGRSYVNAIRCPAGSGIVGYVSESGELMNITDAYDHELFEEETDLPSGTGEHLYSILCVPVKNIEGTVVGVLGVANKRKPVESNGGAGNQPELFGINLTPNSGQQLSSPRPSSGRSGYRTTLSLPIKDSEELSSIYSSFSKEDEYLLMVLGIRVANIINSINAYEHMAQAQRKVEVLLETTRSLSSCVDLQELIQLIKTAAMDLLSADRCAIFLLDHDKKQLWSHIQVRAQIQEIRFPMNVGVAGHCAITGEPVNIPEAYKDPRFNPEVDKQTGYVTKNILCMPIKNIEGKIVGVTQMINKAEGKFGPEDEKLLEAFSSQAAVAIEKSYLFKTTEEMRLHLQSILSSITNCVVTFSEGLKLTTINRSWFVDAIGISEEEMRATSAEEWLSLNNTELVLDLKKVFSTSVSAYSAEYQLKDQTGSTCTFVNYTIVPLLTEGKIKGVVMVLEDISTEKRAMMTLGRYMSPALAKQVMEEGGTQLGGTRKKCAILFSDIRSFTTISEKMEPHDVVDLLNRLFSDEVNAILAEQGILDKYIGDAVMAVFGVPFVSPEDSIHACNAALRIVHSLEVFNKERISQGLMPIRMGIGINTGETLSGNIGSEKRMEFSHIGDSVNLASRTEGLTKYYGVEILITEYTYAETMGFVVREIDIGKQEPIRFYQLLGKEEESIPPSTLKLINMYQEGLRYYRQREFQKASLIFEEIITTLSPEDTPTNLMLSRCRNYAQNPPPADWNGVYISSKK